MVYELEAINHIAEHIDQGADWRLCAQQLMDDVYRDPSSYNRIAGIQVTV